MTNYGSVILDGMREFEIVGDTDLRIDGAPSSEATLQSMGTGFVARVLVGDDANSDLTSGTALGLYVDHLVIGPVTGVAVGNTFKAFGQMVMTSASTEGYDAGTPTSISTLLVALTTSDVVAVSGYASANNVLMAERVERNPAWATAWKLTGPVSGLAGSTLDIGTQVVDFTGVTPTNCGAGLTEGDWVDVRATPVATPFSGTLSGVTSLSCFEPGLLLPPGMSEGTVQASIDGLVDSDAVELSPTMWAFSVEGQGVLTDAGTIFISGEPLDIRAGVHVEVQGKLDLASGILSAKQVRFAKVRVRMRGPVELGDVDPGVSLTTLGVTAYKTPLTKDPTGVLGGATSGQFRTHGYLDLDGKVYADLIVPQGPINYNNVNLRGPVGTVSAGSHTFTILSVTIDTSDPGTKFYAADGTEVSEAAFLAQLVNGKQVQVSSGTYSAGTITLADTISLID